MVYPTIIETKVRSSAAIIHPFIELKRAQLLNNIQAVYLSNMFCAETEVAFANLYSPKATVAKLFAGWLFRQHSLRKTTDDPLIPSPGGDYQSLINSLGHSLLRDKSLSDVGRLHVAETTIKRMDFDSQCKNSLQVLAEFQNQHQRYFLPTTFSIVKKDCTKIRNDQYLADYVSLELVVDRGILSMLGFDAEIKTIIDLKKSFYEKLCMGYEVFSGDLVPQDRDMLIWCLACRYQAIDTGAAQASMFEPKILQYLNEEFGLETELFASGMNHTLPKYCSLFFDIEQYFGSLGSFFEVKPKQGLFLANPPFKNDIMEPMAKRFIECLTESEQAGCPLGFLLVIPVWDEEGKDLIAATTGTPGNSGIDYGGYPTLETLTESGFLRDKRLTINYLLHPKQASAHSREGFWPVYTLILTNTHFKEDLSIINRLHLNFVHPGGFRCITMPVQ